MTEKFEMPAWYPVYEKTNPELAKIIVSEQELVWTKKNVLPRKVKELIGMSLAAVTGVSVGVTHHASLALKHGATREEVFDALSLLSAWGINTYAVAATAALEAMKD
jgi:AhpD family alkylhydroperoxidase